MKLDYDVIIIGSGPTGIAAATTLKQQGVRDIVILEREAQPGGVPRHCLHPTFGLLTFKRPMKGSSFIEKILAPVSDVPILTGTTVVEIHPEGKLSVSCDKGLIEMRARRVLIATGARETPRHPRLVSGLRPQGVLTTGALQQFIYLNRQKPCRRPVVIGSEIVSFSALWTLRNAGAKAQAMIESRDRIVANRPFQFVAGAMGVPLYLNTKLLEIGGLDRVEYVRIERNGQTERIDCDAVIFTGEFTGEYTLLRRSHLDTIVSTGNPVTDARGQCSDPTYYACGNLLHPADMGDQCYQEGKAVGLAIAESLKQGITSNRRRIAVRHDENIQFTVPACLDGESDKGPVDINIRVNRAVSGQVTVKADGVVIYQGNHRCLPGRRIMLKKVNAQLIPLNATEISVSIV